MKFFRFPEFLLVITVGVISFFLGRREMIDILAHDTYFVFGSYRGVNHFFLAIMIVLVGSWGVHLLCRRYGVLGRGWRWGQVGVSLVSVGVILGVVGCAEELKSEMGLKIKL